jgi:2-iminobutanoate/2-iminopropanoate deaminase
MSHQIFVPATAAPEAGDSLAKQTAATLAHLDARLRAKGSSLADAVVMTVYLRRAGDFSEMNDQYRLAWKGAPPTRTTVIVNPATPAALVEMSAVAVPTGAERRPVHPSSWMASPNPYSYAIRSGDLLFLSGLIARRGKDNTVVSGDVATQSRAVLENAKELLEAAGLSFAHVVSARVFLPDLKDFAEMNRIYREYLGADRPARATVGASLTAPAYNVEMTFVASSSPRQGIEIAAEPNPNLSAAVRAGNALFVSGMLAEGDALKEGGGAQTRDILRRLDAVLAKAAFARADVRELLVYVTDDQSGRDAAAECRTAFGANTAVTLVTVGLALTGARVEIMSYAERV